MACIVRKIEFEVEKGRKKKGEGAAQNRYP